MGRYAIGDLSQDMDRLPGEQAEPWTRSSAICRR
ncbi:hypothetical protein [Pantoea ananatis]